MADPRKVAIQEKMVMPGGERGGLGAAGIDRCINPNISGEVRPSKQKFPERNRWPNERKVLLPQLNNIWARRMSKFRFGLPVLERKYILPI